MRQPPIDHADLAIPSQDPLISQVLFTILARLGLWLTQRHRQQLRDVVHHRLHASSNRLITA